MAGLQILGGVGAGIMKGAAFQQQKKMQDQQMQMNEARLGMLNEEHQWRRDDRQIAQAEAQRKAAFDGIYNSVWEEYGIDADPLQVSREAFRRSLSDPIASPRREELEPFVRDVGQLRQRGITNAIRMGDTQALSAAFGQQFGQPVQIQTQMSKDQFGHQIPIFSIIGQDGAQLGQFDALQVGAILGADDILEDEERRLSMAKTGSEINRNLAAAANNQSLAADRNASRREAEALRAAQVAVAGGKATPEQEALVRSQQREGRTGNPPAEVQTAEWLIERGIVTDPAEAWRMVRSVREKSREAAVTEIFLKLRNSTQYMLGNVSEPEIVREANRIFDAIHATQSAGGVAEDDSDPLGLFR